MLSSEDEERKAGTQKR